MLMCTLAIAFTSARGAPPGHVEKNGITLTDHSTVNADNFEIIAANQDFTFIVSEVPHQVCYITDTGEAETAVNSKITCVNEDRSITYCLARDGCNLLPGPNLITASGLVISYKYSADVAITDTGPLHDSYVLASKENASQFHAQRLHGY